MAMPPACRIGFLILFGAGSAWAGPKAEEVTLRGQVLTLTSALQSLELDVKADPESAAKQVVLLGEDRSITPLFCDDASRALFLDERLRGCRAQIRGRRFPGVPYLQVSTVQVERDGRLQTPEYYCDVCAISVRSPQICPCCQGAMELRMKPEGR
jgi:hypothetical protein